MSLVPVFYESILTPPRTPSQNLIRSMLSLDPSARLSCADYLSQYRGSAFPDIFYTFLHPFISSLNDVAPPPPPPAPRPLSTTSGTATGGTATPGGVSGVVDTPAPQATLRSNADEKIERVWSEWETISGFLGCEGAKEEETKEGEKAGRNEVSAVALLPIPRLAHILRPGHFPDPNAHPRTRGRRSGSWRESGCVAGLPFTPSLYLYSSSLDGPALVLLSLVSSNIRNCVRPTSVLRGLDTLLALSHYLTDETKLDRLVPYLVAVLQDDMPAVRSAALRSLTQVVRRSASLSASYLADIPSYSSCQLLP